MILSLEVVDDNGLLFQEKEIYRLCKVYAVGGEKSSLLGLQILIKRWICVYFFVYVLLFF